MKFFGSKKQIVSRVVVLLRRSHIIILFVIKIVYLWGWVRVSDQFPASSWKGIHSGKQTFNFSTAKIGIAPLQPTHRVVGCMGSVDKTVKFRRKQELPFISLNMCTVDGE